MAGEPVVSDLISAVERSVSRRGEDRQAENLRQVTDLYLREAPGLDQARVGVFDEVLGRLAEGVEVGPRAELAARLAEAGTAPPSLVRRLAEDEISVARPLLARSSLLTDDDLAAIAAKGSGHRLAIAEREELGERVTDALVTSGDRVAAHAVACHPGARLSGASAAALVERANSDGTLRTLLTGRADLPAGSRDQLAAIRGEGDGGGVLTLDLAAGAGQARFGRALAAVQTLADMRPLTEDDIAAFLDGGEVAEALCAMALLAGLPVSLVVRLFEPSRTDLLLLVAKSQGWAWATARALLAVQARGEPEPRLRGVYEAMAPTAAARVLQVLTARTRQGRPEPRQIRSKVR